MSHLCIFPDVFQKCEKALWWERKIPEQDSEDTRIFQKSEKSDGAEKGLSYLYLSGMQAENPDSERQRKDRDPLSEVRDNIYQEELRLHKG